MKPCGKCEAPDPPNCGVYSDMCAACYQSWEEGQEEDAFDAKREAQREREDREDEVQGGL